MSAGKSENDDKLPQTEDKNKQNIGIIPGYASFDQFTKDGYKVLMEGIRNSNSLPNGRDWNFYNAHQSFTQIVNEEGNTILKQINSILRNNKIEGNIRNRVLEEKTELMVEANDMILERVANNIDEMNGIRKTVVEPVLIQTVSAQLPINGSWNRVNNATFSVSSSITSEPFKKTGNAIRLLTGKNILRPQKFFKDKIINSCKYPWEPRIKEKPNSLKPLAIFLETTEKGEEYSHPYEFELDRFTPLPKQLKKENPLIPIKVKDTPLIEINQPEQLEELVATLRRCKEFAVDLEHHSYRSFMGITCLMQISTMEEDYLIDTLALRDKLELLNEVFTKPSIVKIFHGADMDIQWLQRDLSLYVVNMFDTYHAAKQLGYPALSLAYLMQRFCNFIPNKHFQLADWRIRPLPEELKSYAREDTHYLIYIYQMLKNELIDKANGQPNILLSVLNSSTETCKKRYFKPVLREDSHLDFYRKCKRLFDNRQLYALKELYKWRDQISREEDESTGYVLPNHMLLQISESLPREMQGILACCNPIPPLVRANLLELHQIILRAKEQPLEKPILKEDTRARGTTLKMSKINMDSPLNCPHDLTKVNDFRDDLPTLLGNESLNLRNLVNNKFQIENTTSTCTVFNTPDDSEEVLLNSNEGIKKLQSFTFLGPFERYKLVKPFIQAEEERLAVKKAEAEAAITAESCNAQEDIRTDEERIESIREHFLNLTKQKIPVEQEKPPDQTLIQMGGSKKRKRDPSPKEGPSESNPAETCLQMTVVNFNDNDNPRKRKSSSLAQDDSPHKIGKLNGGSFGEPKQKFNKKNRINKKKQKGNQDQQDDGEHSQDQNAQSTYSQQYHGYNDERDDNYPGQSNSSSQGESDISNEHSSFHIDRNGSRNNRFNHPGGTRTDFRNGRGGKHKNKNKTGSQQTNQTRQNQDFTPYDYSSVDFRQFQGGAGGAQRSQEFKSTFKSKGNKKKGNKGNKGSTFGNFGRGGKRGR